MTSDSGLVIDRDCSSQEVSAPIYEMEISLKDSQLMLKPSSEGVELFNTLRIRSENGMLCLRDGKKRKIYRGIIEFRAIDKPRKRLLVINEVDLEDYLKSVVPAEMPATFPRESLKAQAVAARSFALSRIGCHSSEFADVCDEAHCQVYTGVISERAETTLAVAATKGQVVCYNDKPICAMYCADCGGMTEAKLGTPYLDSVTDCDGNGDGDYCSKNPSHHWTLILTRSLLEKKWTQAKENSIGKILNLTVSETDSSGRVKQILLQGESGSKQIAGDTFRRLVGLSVLRSTRFVIESSDTDGWTLKGSGTGHGIGLCQMGAKGLASDPYRFDYSQILKHYYKGIEIKTVP